jgi:hypothetical protein
MLQIGKWIILSRKDLDKKVGNLMAERSSALQQQEISVYLERERNKGLVGEIERLWEKNRVLEEILETKLHKENQKQ